MLKKWLSYKKDLFLYILIASLIIISSFLFVSLRVTSFSLDHHYETYSKKYHKNDFIIVPAYHKLDQLIETVTFYEFETYQEAYANTPYALIYDNIKNIENNPYLSPEEVKFINQYITEDFIQRIKNSTKPSLVIYQPIRQLIYDNLDLNLPDYYRNKVAETQAKYYTKLLFLLTLNETNYLKFIEYTLDQRLLAKDENNEYLDSTYAKKYDLTIEKKIVKKETIHLDNKQVDLFLTSKQKVFNHPYVIKSLDHHSKLKLDHQEIAIFQEFAEFNHLKLGDFIFIHNKKYKVKAFIYTPDTIHPILTNNEFNYELDKDTLVLMNEDDFSTIETNDFYSITYTAKFNQEGNSEKQLLQLQNQFKEDNLLLNARLGISDEVIQVNIYNFNLLSYVLSFSILIISIVFMAILLIRKVNQQQRQIGLLKALGYKKSEIMRPYITHFFILVFISIILGFILGLLGSKLLLLTLYKIFLLPYSDIKFNISIMVGILIPLMTTTLVNVFIMNKKLSKKSIQLLNETDTIYIKPNKYSLQLKITFFIIITTILSTLMSFIITKEEELLFILIGFLLIYILYYFSQKQTFTRKVSRKMSQRNIKKILSFNITLFLTTLLILFVFHIKNVFVDLYRSVENNYTYSTYIKYPNFINLTLEDLQQCEHCEGTVLYKFELHKANNRNINEEVFFGGYKDNTPSMLKFIDTHLLQDNQVLISKPLQDKYHLEVNDTLSIVTNIISDKPHNTTPCLFDNEKRCEIDTVKIVGICDNYIALVIYGNISLLNEWYYGDREHQSHINVIYTSNLANTDDFVYTDNILTTYQIDDIFAELDFLLYTLVLITNLSFIFITIISIIMTLIIMEITVKDNEIQIAQLKALGYHNKEIKTILLNQYSPYVLLIFIFTLPLSYYASYALFRYIGLSMNKTLLVHIHYMNIIISFILILMIYTISSYLAFIRIKKISLASWLK